MNAISGNFDALARPGTERLVSIDVLRGMAIVIMTLDHVRDFVHQGAMTGSPTDLNSTTFALFMTRWITHVCAPVFALTAGFGAWAWWHRGRSLVELSRFLAVRGALLVGLELTVMQLAYSFSFPDNNPVFLLVLWTLGLSMIALALLVWLPVGLLASLALGLMLLHPLIGFLGPEDTRLIAKLLDATHGVGVFELGGRQVVAPYPLLPWLGVMIFGFCLGPLFQTNSNKRNRQLLIFGGLALLGFLILRTTNIYGDPAPWTLQKTDILTFLSFINVTKYPASPSFLLMTLAPALLFLAFFDRLAHRGRAAWTLLASLGRVPLFYYVTHFYCAHLVATTLAFATYGSRAGNFIWLQYPSFGGPGHRFPADFGYSLLATYAVWLFVLISSGALALHYHRRKFHSRKKWLSLF